MIKKRTPLSFFILGGHIYYSTEQGGLEHDKLWKYVVLAVFPHLDASNKRDLLNAPYATDRGRVVWTGETDVNDLPIEKGKGQYKLYGTPGCASYEEKLLKLFKLSELKNTTKLQIDWVTDPHYKVQKHDKDILDFLMKITRDKTEYKDLHVAKVKILVKEALRKKSLK